MIFVQDLNVVTRNSLRDGARKSWKNFSKLLLIQKITSNRPPCLSLPPGVVYDNVRKVLVYPLYGIRVAPFSNQSKAINCTRIIFLDPLTLIIFLLHNSNCCWGHINACDLVLLNFLPNDTSIGCDWLSFEENTCCSSDKRSIYNKGMTNYPANITRGEVDAAFVNIEDVLHAKVQSNNSSTRVTNYTFRLASSS